LGTLSKLKFELGNAGFLRRRENWSTRKKPPGAEKSTNNILNPHMTPGTGIKPDTHWWEADM